MREIVTIEAPAKINLTLDVKGRRSDNYHEIETIMHQVDLADLVFVRRKAEGIRVITDLPELPDDESNLAYKAAQEFFRKTGIAAGVEVIIKKKIPVGAGLAGGSTDAAAVIKGLDCLYGTGLSLEEMLEIAATVGSDVPFCILGGTALARGRGEILTPLATDIILTLVLVKPNFSVSTKEVYEGLATVEITERPDTQEVMRGLMAHDIETVCRGLRNVLEEVTASWFPEVRLIKAKMKELKAQAALMSGSGPTVFGLFKEEGEAVEAFNHFRLYYEETYLVKSYRKGEGKDAGEKTYSCEAGQL